MVPTGRDDQLDDLTLAEVASGSAALPGGIQRVSAASTLGVYGGASGAIRGSGSGETIRLLSIVLRFSQHPTYRFAFRSAVP